MGDGFAAYSYNPQASTGIVVKTVCIDVFNSLRPSDAYMRR